MTFSKIFIIQKLDAFARYTKELQELLEKVPDEKFLSEPNTLHIAERLVQLIVDGMIDINQHFIRELNLPISDDLQGTFSIVGENRILPLDFAKKIAPIAGLRNILVHQYEELDKKLFVKNLRKHFSDFAQYQEYITEYLEQMK